MRAPRPAPARTGAGGRTNRLLRPRAILERIRDLLDLPARRDADPRHATLRATIGWSHDLLSAGAPVRSDVLARMASVLAPPAQVHTPFGATESLPVASIGSDEVLRDTLQGTASGKGICVGRPAPEMTVRIIRTSDEPIERWSDDLLVQPGEVGEITVRGPVVTSECEEGRGQHREHGGPILAQKREQLVAVERAGDRDGRADAQGAEREFPRHRTVSGHAVYHSSPVSRTAVRSACARTRFTGQHLAYTMHAVAQPER